MKEDALYQLALTRTPGIGPAHTKKLIDRFGNAKAIFQARKETLAQARLRPAVASAIGAFNDWSSLEDELQLLEKKGGRMLFCTDPDYPQRLLSFSDFPPVLFYKGQADLNAKKIIAVVGTRGPSEYGREITEQLIRQLAQPDLLIISGLAYGIDACAHSAAVKNNMPTVGILGHGLGHFYPHENIGLAKAMLPQGGLLTTFGWHTPPESHQFPMRNNIVAGLCDALIVVETGSKGGSLLTVKTALTYGKKIFAVPGRINDPRSTGCNELISQQKAELLFSGKQLQAAMGWEWPAGQAGIQPSLPFATGGQDWIETVCNDWTGTADNGGTGASGNDGKGAAGNGRAGDGNNQTRTARKILLKLLTETKSLSFDELSARSQLETSAVSIGLLTLELQGLISPLPGKRYRLN